MKLTSTYVLFLFPSYFLLVFFSATQLALFVSSPRTSLVGLWTKFQPTQYGRRWRIDDEENPTIIFIFLEIIFLMELKTLFFSTQIVWSHNNINIGREFFTELIWLLIRSACSVVVFVSDSLGPRSSHFTLSPSITLSCNSICFSYSFFFAVTSRALSTTPRVWKIITHKIEKFCFSFHFTLSLFAAFFIYYFLCHTRLIPESPP